MNSKAYVRKKTTALPIRRGKESSNSQSQKGKQTVPVAIQEDVGDNIKLTMFVMFIGFYRNILQTTAGNDANGKPNVDAFATPPTTLDEETKKKLLDLDIFENSPVKEDVNNLLSEATTMTDFMDKLKKYLQNKLASLHKQLSQTCATIGAKVTKMTPDQFNKAQKTMKDCRLDIETMKKRNQEILTAVSNCLEKNDPVPNINDVVFDYDYEIDWAAHHGNPIYFVHLKQENLFNSWDAHELVQTVDSSDGIQAMLINCFSKWVPFFTNIVKLNFAIGRGNTPNIWYYNILDIILRKWENLIRDGKNFTPTEVDNHNFEILKMQLIALMTWFEKLRPEFDAAEHDGLNDSKEPKIHKMCLVWYKNFVRAMPGDINLDCLCKTFGCDGDGGDTVMYDVLATKAGDLQTCEKATLHTMLDNLNNTELGISLKDPSAFKDYAEAMASLFDCLKAETPQAVRFSIPVNEQTREVIKEVTNCYENVKKHVEMDVEEEDEATTIETLTKKGNQDDNDDGEMTVVNARTPTRKSNRKIVSCKPPNINRADVSSKLGTFGKEVGNSEQIDLTGDNAIDNSTNAKTKKRTSANPKKRTSANPKKRTSANPKKRTSANPKKRKGNAKSKGNGSKRARKNDIPLATDTLAPWTPFRIVKSGDQYEQKVVGGLWNENKTEFTLNKDVQQQINPEETRDVVYWDLQAGATVHNLQVEDGNNYQHLKKLYAKTKGAKDANRVALDHKGWPELYFREESSEEEEESSEEEEEEESSEEEEEEESSESDSSENSDSDDSDELDFGDNFPVKIVAQCVTTSGKGGKRKKTVGIRIAEDGQTMILTDELDLWNNETYDGLEPTIYTKVKASKNVDKDKFVNPGEKNPTTYFLVEKVAQEESI